MLNSYIIQFLSIILTLAFLVFIARLIKRGKLREEYSFVWFAMGLIFLFFSFYRGALDKLAQMLGVYYAPALLFMMLFFAIIIFLVHLSVVNSKQTRQIKDLAQEIALLKKRSS